MAKAPIVIPEDTRKALCDLQNDIMIAQATLKELQAVYVIQNAQILKHAGVSATDSMLCLDCGMVRKMYIRKCRSCNPDATDPVLG